MYALRAASAPAHQLAAAAAELKKLKPALRQLRATERLRRELGEAEERLASVTGLPAQTRAGSRASDISARRLHRQRVREEQRLSGQGRR